LVELGPLLPLAASSIRHAQVVYHLSAIAAPLAEKTKSQEMPFVKDFNELGAGTKGGVKAITYT
jgi:hypothetical protein